MLFFAQLLPFQIARANAGHAHLGLNGIQKSAIRVAARPPCHERIIHAEVFSLAVVVLLGKHHARVVNLPQGGGSFGVWNVSAHAHAHAHALAHALFFAKAASSCELCRLSSSGSPRSRRDMYVAQKWSAPPWWPLAACKWHTVPTATIDTRATFSCPFTANNKRGYR